MWDWVHESSRHCQQSSITHKTAHWLRIWGSNLNDFICWQSEGYLIDQQFWESLTDEAHHCQISLHSWTSQKWYYWACLQADEWDVDWLPHEATGTYQISTSTDSIESTSIYWVSGSVNWSDHCTSTVLLMTILMTAAMFYWVFSYWL